MNGALNDCAWEEVGVGRSVSGFLGFVHNDRAVAGRGANLWAKALSSFE